MNHLLLAAAATVALLPQRADAQTERRPWRVVLDPGHGGSNAGALGPALLEKTLTLELARLVAEELMATDLPVEVSLTRKGDQTLTLRQRSEIANRLGADLFVSLHANASPTRSQRGFETYVLTPSAIEVIAPALRSEAPAPRPGASDAVAAVLDDIERGATQWESAELAVGVQRALRATRGAGGDRGVRQDAQHVLLGATMPAVLVEVGFVDHPAEGRDLARPSTQREIAHAIAAAISDELVEAASR